MGKGIFSRRWYRPHEIIGEIDGLRIENASYGSDYCFDIGDDLRLEPAPPFRFINHSCDPNCEFNWFDLSSPATAAPQRRIFLFALWEIKPSDELTIDYNWAPQAAIPCRCRSPYCRGWIVDPDQLSRVTGRGSTAAPRASGC